MYYYAVLVASRSKTDQLFTYASGSKLATGTIVSVPFAKFNYYGIIVNPTDPHPKAKAAQPTSLTIPASLLRAALNLAQHSAIEYSGIARSLLSGMSERQDLSASAPGKTSTKLPRLTADQQMAVSKIQATSDTPTLLQGITGSGKTRIYLELTKDVLAEGKSAIVLAPEVGLSSQLSYVFKSAWPDKVIEFNSLQTPKQRQEAWLKIALSKEPLVIIGPRSALFSPVKNLSLIVLDEFHDDSYKQTSQPRYHGLHFANLLAKEAKAIAVFGSATPNVADYQQFLSQNYTIIKLSSKVLKSDPVEIEIVNTTDLKLKAMLSPPAIAAITTSLNKNQQAMIFFNRRGTARLIVCDDCGWVHECPNCDYALTLHKDTAKMVCHTCSYSSQPKTSCPDCSSSISYKIPGIKKLTDEIQNLFVNTNIVRFDSDNLKADSLSQRLEEVADQPRTIIIGTQLISKGLDLKLLSSVVIINSEGALSIPDYRSDERMFQQLTQLIGRVGRGHTASAKVVLQTRTPSSATLKASAAQDWDMFYQAELKRRQQAKLPPFIYLATIIIKRKTDAGAQKAAINLALDKSKLYPEIDFRGPSPALKAKQGGYFIWHIHCFSKRRSNLVKLAKEVGSKEYIELDPLNLF